jgi:small subunit ribosomal protein S8e
VSVRHGNLHKRKPTGGKRHPYRKMRRYERGSFPTETTLGEPKRKIDRRRGGNIKIRVLSDLYASVSNPSTGETKKVKILRVVKNPANIDYNRRGVITKGTIIETELGMAEVTSRPGQDGVINSVLISEKET